MRGSHVQCSMCRSGSFQTDRWDRPGMVVPAGQCRLRAMSSKQSSVLLQESVRKFTPSVGIWFFPLSQLKLFESKSFTITCLYSNSSASTINVIPQRPEFKQVILSLSLICQFPNWSQFLTTKQYSLRAVWQNSVKAILLYFMSKTFPHKASFQELTQTHEYPFYPKSQSKKLMFSVKTPFSPFSHPYEFGLQLFTITILYSSLLSGTVNISWFMSHELTFFAKRPNSLVFGK